MTDPDERTINRAICLLSDEHQTEREEARAALHRMFRRVRRHEARIEQLEAVANRSYPVVGDVLDEQWLAGYKRGIERVRDDLLAALQEDPA